MPVLKLPESFGNDVPAKVRVHQGTITENTVVLQLDTECGYASVEMTPAEADQLRQMLFCATFANIEVPNDSL